MLLAHSQGRKMTISCSFWKLHAEFFSDLNISTASGLAREPNASFPSPAQI